MENNLRFYNHNGVDYVYDIYSGITVTENEFKVDRSRRVEEYRILAAEEAKRKETEEAERIATDPVYRAKVERKIARETARAAKVAADREIRSELKTKAEVLAAKMIKEGAVVTEKTIDDWKIANGYLWKVVSPKGRVYTETIKPITIDCPEDYVTYHAMFKVVYPNSCL